MYLKGEPGTNVGVVDQRIGTTDIALAKLLPSIEFRNEFMEIDARPKKFLLSKDLRVGDKFLIDSFVTNRQKLMCVGARAPVYRRANSRGNLDLLGPAHLLPRDENVYVKLRQGIHATNTPLIPCEPKIREGVCGAVLVRCFSKKDPDRTDDEVLKDGDVAGIMHFADLRSKTSCDSTLFCYADSFDELVGEGWGVVQTVEKRKACNDEEELAKKRRDGINE